MAAVRGWSELLLMGAVCAAAWTRTPVGTLAENGVALWRGQDTEDVLAHFSTELPARVSASLQRALATQTQGPAAAELPAGWTPALHTAAQVHLGPEAAAQVLALGIADPEAALETWAVGAEQRQRAIRRARAAGESSPERLASHRRYLPAEAAAQAQQAVSEVLALGTALDLTWPVDRGVRISSPFGWRVHPVLGTRRMHEGVDLAIPTGTPVSAAGQGKVLRARADSVSGEHVVLDHGHGVSTNYCHGERLHVSTGQAVESGQQVMDSGSSGRSTGPHLHFGLRIDGRAVDPSFFRDPGAERDAES